MFKVELANPSRHKFLRFEIPAERIFYRETYKGVEYVKTSIYQHFTKDNNVFYVVEVKRGKINEKIESQDVKLFSDYNRAREECGKSLDFCM